MLPALMILATMITLAYASVYDYRHKKIEYFVIVLLFIFGITFLISNETNYLNVGIAMLTMTMFFGGALIFGMGLGDFLVFMALSCYFETIDDIVPFMVTFAILSIVTVILYYWKVPKIRQGIMKFEFPLIPVIYATYSFYILLKIISV